MADLIKAPINYAVSAGGQFVKGGSAVFGFINIRPDAANPATLKPIYLDSALISQAANPQGLSSDAVFDQANNGVLFGADDDSYSVIIYDANDVELSYIPVYNLSDATAAANAQAAEAGAIAAESGAVTAQGLAEAAQVAAEAAAVTAVATLDEFQDIYWGAYASTPALSPVGNPATEGDLYFNTTSASMQVYNGSLWQATASAVTGVRNEETYTSSAGVSTFAIIYDLGFVDVYVNGVKLIQDVNYTAGTGTDITLTWPLAFATDTLQAVAYSTVEFGDFGTAAFVDTGTLATEVPLNSDLGSASLVDTGLLTGNVPTADDLSMVGQTVNYTGVNYQPNIDDGIGVVILMQNNSGGNVSVGVNYSGSLLKYYSVNSSGALAPSGFAVPAGRQYKLVSPFGLSNLGGGYFSRQS